MTADTSGETQLHNFDLAGAYTAFLDQIEDNQSPAGSDHAGSVPDCVPFYGGHCHLPSSPSWGTAYPSLANWVFEYYDDHALLHKHYTKVKAYVDSLTARAQIADKLNHTLLDSGGWGDWCAPTGSLNKTGCGGHGTCGGAWEYISGLRIIVSWATAIGAAADVATYKALESKVSAAFATAYFGEGGFSCPSTTAQTANALGLMVAPSTTDALAALVGEVKAKGNHLDTGIVGTKYLLETLSRGGRADVALAVMQSDSYPGFGFWVSQGATSLWETWEGARYHPHSRYAFSSRWLYYYSLTNYSLLRSWNHVMFGSTSEWFFRHLAGIQQAPGAMRGYRSLVFHPSVLLSPAGLSVCANLSWVNASMLRPHGTISAAWACNAQHDGISYELVTPVGVQSHVHVPVVAKGAKAKVEESGIVIWDGSRFVSGVVGVLGAVLAGDAQSVEVTIGAGRYKFSSTPL
jgi:alpha-L-rhamnosidase